MKADFDEAIGVVPPGGVDVDAVIIRGRNTVRARQNWVAAGAGVAAVAVFLALVPFRGGGPRPVPGIGTPDSPAASAGLPPGVVHAVPSAAPAGPVPADIKARLDAAFAARIATDLPGATYVDPDPGHQPAIATFISSYQTVSDGSHSYEAVALLKDPAGVSLLRLQIYDVYPFPYTCTGTASCRIAELADGQLLFAQAGPATPRGKPQNVAAASKPDGSTAEVAILTDLTSAPATAATLKIKWTAEAFGPARSEPPLTVEQLAPFVTDPRFSFHP